MKTYTLVQRRNNEVSHHDFYAQFITEETRRFVLSALTIEQISKALDSGDEHLNGLKIPFNNMSSGGGWWWDITPVNIKLIIEAGESNMGSTNTCVGKAAAIVLVNEFNNKN